MMNNSTTWTTPGWVEIKEEMQAVADQPGGIRGGLENGNGQIDAVAGDIRGMHNVRVEGVAVLVHPRHEGHIWL